MYFRYMEEFGNCAEKKHYRDCKYIKNSVETYSHFLTNVCKNPYNKGIHLNIVHYKYIKDSVETYNHFLTNVCKNPYNKGIHIHLHCTLNDSMTKRKRSDLVLWQKPLHPQKNPKKQRDNTKNAIKKLRGVKIWPFNISTSMLRALLI